MRLFISHSHKDEAIYSPLCLGLDAAEIPRWDVSSIPAGSSLAEELRFAIESCDICVFLATERSIESPWCLAELGAFWGAAKRVIVYVADPELDESRMPPQFQGNLWVNSASQLFEALQTAKKDSYDVFLASPMAAYDSDEEYEKAYAEVVKVCEAFRSDCEFEVYSAVEKCPTKRSFEAADVSVKIDLKAIRNSQYFVMLYPRKIASSILLEAGFALALRKNSVYFVNNRDDLPFMLREVSGVFPDVSLQEQSCSSNYDEIVNTIRINKRRLFDIDAV